jgi:hypothetical protein
VYRKLLGIGVAVVVAVLVFGGLAQAQTQAPSIKIGFSFYAAGKEYKSGNYTIEVTPAGHVVFHAAKGDAVVDLTPMKSLGRDDKIQSPKLVFDIIGADRFLSEVWLPGQEGYLVGSVSGPHDREVLGARKNKK